MKKLSVKKVFILIMFLWIVDIACIIRLFTAVRLLFALLFGAGYTFLCGFVVWDILKRLE